MLIEILDHNEISVYHNAGDGSVNRFLDTLEKYINLKSRIPALKYFAICKGFDHKDFIKLNHFAIQNIEQFKEDVAKFNEQEMIINIIE